MIPLNKIGNKQMISNNFGSRWSWYRC